MKIPSVFSTTILAGLGLTLGAIHAEAFPAYQPKPRGIPNTRVSGGTRAPSNQSCITDPQSPGLTSLFPDDDLGYTTNGYPAFQWYMPSNNASHVEFNLYEVVGEEEDIFQPVYQTTFVPNPEAGIATLQLPQEAGLSPLSPDNYYYWSVDVYCPDDAAAAMTADGFVERLVLDPTLAVALDNSSGLDRAAIAAENSLWFDATQALTEQLQAQPDDQQVLASWRTLLESIGLENIADAPLLP